MLKADCCLEYGVSTGQRLLKIYLLIVAIYVMSLITDLQIKAFDLL